MTASTLLLTNFETRVSTLLSDSGSILWTLAEKDEGIRQALGDISRLAGVKLTISGLDAAAATTLDTLDEDILIKGAAAYAARTRAIARAQQANIGETMPAALLDWAKSMTSQYQDTLKQVKTRYHNLSTNPPSSALTWDESNKNW